MSAIEDKEFCIYFFSRSILDQVFVTCRNYLLVC